LGADDFEGIYEEMDNTNKIREILRGIPFNSKVEKQEKE
jgi:prephenate dehydrogenase